MSRVEGTQNQAVKRRWNRLYNLLSKYNMLSCLKNFGIKIWQKIEEQLAKYIAGLIFIILLTLFFVLKEWFLKVHAIQMYNCVWFLLCVSFIFLIVYFLFNLFKIKKRLTDADDIKGAINDWFNNSYIYCSFKKGKSISFQSLDDDLKIKKGSSRKYLPILAQENKHGIEIGKKTFKLVSLTDKNNWAKIIQEYLPSEKGSKKWLIPTYAIDNKLRWPKGTTKNCIVVYSELDGKYDNYKFKNKGNGNILIQKKCNSTPIAE